MKTNIIQMYLSPGMINTSTDVFYLGLTGNIVSVLEHVTTPSNKGGPSYKESYHYFRNYLYVDVMYSFNSRNIEKLSFKERKKKKLSFVEQQHKPKKVINNPLLICLIKSL